MNLLYEIYRRVPRTVQRLVPPLIKDLYKDNVLGKGYENAISSIYELPSLPDPEINLLIVGARYGPYDHISAAKHIQNINIVGIEPDPQECERLRKNWPNCTFHQTAIGGRTGTEQLYILKHPGKSSVYEPNFDVLQRWGIPTEKYELTESHSVEVTTLDKFTSTHDYEFDFIQIDTQGAEGDIISGGKKTLESSLGLNSEQNIIERYDGIMTFFEIHDLLKKSDFELVKSAEFTPVACDTCYFKDDWQTDEANRFKYIVLSLMIGHPKLAHAVAYDSSNGGPDEQLEEVREIIKTHCL